MKPGETFKFIFSFRSRVPGVFQEKWTVVTDPPCLNELTPVHLSGHAIEDDPHVEWRNEMDIKLDRRHINKWCREYVSDVVERVRTPTPPLPDLNDPEVCRHEFEAKNVKHRLWHQQTYMNWFRILEKDIYMAIGLRPEKQYWDLNINYLSELLTQVKDEVERECLERRFKELVALSKKRPIERSPLFNHTKSLLNNAVEEILPRVENQVRAAADLLDYQFREPVDITEEELKKRKEEEAKVKAEFYKKIKKKPKTEEEEKKLMMESKEKVTAEFKNNLLDLFNGFDRTTEFVNANHEIDELSEVSVDYYDKLKRKKTITDQDLEGKRILLRVHLVVKPRVAPPPQPEPQIQNPAPGGKPGEKGQPPAKPGEKPSAQPKGPPPQPADKGVKGGKGNAPQKGDPKAAENNPPLEEKKLEDEPLTIDNIDEASLKIAMNDIRYCLDHLAKLTIILVSIGDPKGISTPSYSSKFFFEHLKTSLDQICHFSENCLIEDFQDQAETFADNSILVLENIFFSPEEIGYTVDDKKVMKPFTDDEEISRFLRVLSSYSNIYVYDDQWHFYATHKTATAIQSETTVYGLNLKQNLLAASAAPTCKSKPFVVLLGGDISIAKLQAMNALLSHVDEIHVLGKIGIYFALYNFGLQKSGKYELGQETKELIDKIYENAKEWPQVKIYHPKDFDYVDKPSDKEPLSAEWFAEMTPVVQSFSLDDPSGTRLVKFMSEDGIHSPVGSPIMVERTLQHQATLPPVQSPPLAAGMFPPDAFILDYSSATQEFVEQHLEQARNILWIGSLSPLGVKLANESNYLVGRAMFKKNEERKRYLELPHEKIKNKLDPGPISIVCIGSDLENAMNLIETLETKPPKARGEEGEELDDEESERQSRITASENQSQAAKEKLTNLQKICEFFSREEEFVLQLLSGKFIRGKHSA